MIAGSGADPIPRQGIAIAQLSQALAVPMPTIRSWELRYGIPSVSRPQGQHRRYLPAEVPAVRLMRDEIVRGHSAGAAAQSVRTQSAGTGRRFHHPILKCSEQMNPGAIRSCLDEARVAVSAAALTTCCCRPCARSAVDGRSVIAMWCRSG
jgi:hypothetical protein